MRRAENMWAWLFSAIAVDVAATVGLRANNGFGFDAISLAVALGYVVAFYCLARSLRQGMKIGVAYGVWGGLGLAAVAALSVLIFGEHLTPVQVLGLFSIICGLVFLKVGGPDESKSPSSNAARDN